MKLILRYQLADAAPVTVEAGPWAISAAEKKGGRRLAVDGFDLEEFAYAAWTQAVADGVFLGPWTEFWGPKTDIELVKAVTGLDPTASPGGSPGT